MSRKRALPDIYKLKKKICVVAPQEQSSSGLTWNADLNDVDLPNDTKAALLFLKSKFPVEKFELRIPPILLKHQIYSIVQNRTLVDKQLGDLRNNGEVRIFHLGLENEEYGVVFTEDYVKHVRQYTSDLSTEKAVIDKFLLEVIGTCYDISLNKSALLKDFKFVDSEITQLVKASVLTVRDVGSWWVSIPAAGVFMKSFIRGRKAVLTMVRKSKYREILQQDLESRKLPKVAKLGISFYIHDIIGADLVSCIQTTSGVLLRLKD